MRNSYKRHYRAAQQGKIPLATALTPHLAGLYGALSSRYVAAGIPQLEPFIWSDLAPFLLMKEPESIEALTEYVSLPRISNERKDWLYKSINNALKKIEESNQDLKAMATMALIQPGIRWVNFLDADVKNTLHNEFLKILPSKDKISPEVYNLLDEELQIKVDNLES